MYSRTDLTGASWDPELDSVFNLGVETGHWSLDAATHFRGVFPGLLQFEAAGAFGLLETYSLLEFSPLQTGSLRIAATSTQFSLGGVDLYALASLSPHTLIPGSAPGIGLMVGGWTRVGGLEIHAQSAFNMWISLFVVANQGFPAFLSGMATQPQWDEYGLSVGWWPSIYSDYFFPLEGTCTLPWSSTEVLIRAPFSCVELTAMFAFQALPLAGAQPFRAVFFAENVPTGLPWLWLDPVILGFEPENKNMTASVELRLGEFACIKPHFSYEPLNVGFDIGISSIELSAITLDCSLAPGVRFKGGHRFSDFPPKNDLYENLIGAFTAWGDFVYLRYSGDTGGQVWNADYDEYYALLVDGDTCCGGEFDAWFYVWFDTTQTGTLFDVAEFVFGADIDISRNATGKFHIGAHPGKIHFIDLGFEIRW